MSWKKVSLSSIASVTMGQSPKKMYVNRTKSGLPLLNGPSEFTEKSPVPTQWTTNPLKVGRIGSILFCVRGSTTGRMNMADQEYAIGRGLASIIGKNNLDTKYIEYALRTNLPALLCLANGSTFPNLSRADLEDFEILLPPKKLRTAIASLLGALDDKIDSLHRTLTLIDELLLTRFKLANSSAEWDTARLDDLFDVRIGRTPPRKETKWFAQPSVSSIAWASIKDMGAVRTYISHTEQALTEDAVKSFRINVAKIGDVLVSFKLTVGRVAIVGREMCTNEAIACIHSEDPLLSEWLYCFLKSFDYSSLGNTSSIGTAVNSKTIKAIRMPMPPGDLLKRFHEFSAPLFQISQRHEKQVSTLTELRDALLPELMSGRMRADEVKGLVTGVLEGNS